MYDLAEGKDIQHGYLGVSLATCTPEWARCNNAKADTESLATDSLLSHLPHFFPQALIINN